jgi:hypothetical protein
VVANVRPGRNDTAMVGLTDGRTIEVYNKQLVSRG